jgi:hypothetical protein
MCEPGRVSGGHSPSNPCELNLDGHQPSAPTPDSYGRPRLSSKCDSRGSRSKTSFHSIDFNWIWTIDLP